jgi:hypothetical protein
MFNQGLMKSQQVDHSRMWHGVSAFGLKANGESYIGSCFNAEHTSEA